jgi:hypothetical protein
MGPLTLRAAAMLCTAPAPAAAPAPAPLSPLGLATAADSGTTRADSIGAALDLSFVATSGNSKLTTLSLAQHLAAATGRWRFTQGVSYVYGRSADSTTAAELKAHGGVGIALTPSLDALTTFRYERNRFAGIARRFEEGASLAWRIGCGGPTTLELESGLTLVQQRGTLGTSDAFVAGRAAARVRRRLTGKAYVRAGAEMQPNLEDLADFRVTAEAALVAPLTGRLSLQVVYNVRIDNRPEPGFGTTDRTFTSGLRVAL